MPLVLVKSRPGVVTLTLNRPERRNALTLAMLEELCAALRTADSDRSIRCIILTGAGGDFSSGFDLIEGGDLANSLRHGELLVQAQMLLAESNAVTIAAVSGYALAGGGALIASCDYAVAAEDAKFGYPVLKVGIVPTPGMPFLRRELKDRDLRTLILGGQLWSGREAADKGLVNRVVASGEAAREEAKQFAEDILKSSPVAVTETKGFLNALDRETLRAEMEEALDIYKRVRQGEQAAEGLKAFAEKRSPNWS